MTSNQNTFHCHQTFFDMQFQASKIFNYCLHLKITFLSPRWEGNCIRYLLMMKSVAWVFIPPPVHKANPFWGQLNLIGIFSGVQQWLYCLALGTLTVVCGLGLFSILSSFHTVPGSLWISFSLQMTQSRYFLIVLDVENRAAELDKAV